MSATIAAVSAGDLRAFAGARVSGSLPVREALLNEAIEESIAKRPGRLKQVDIRIGSNNVIECGVRVAIGPFAKWFRPQVIVSPRVVSNQLILTVASSEYMGLMWIAQVFAAQFFPRGFSVDGRQIVLDLSAVPQMAHMRDFLRYLRSLEIRTVPGAVWLQFHVEVS